jgi:hypothetical protein
VDVEVFPVHHVAVWAETSDGPALAVSLAGLASLNVLSVCDRLEMFGVHASWNSAEMV